MRILVLGGTRFIGAHAVVRLAARGHELVLFNRGRSAEQCPLELPELQQIHGERADLASFAAELRALQADLVIDMRPLSRADAQAVHDIFSGFAARLVALSSVDVYQAYDVLRGLTSGSDPDSGLEPTPITESSPLRVKHFPYRLEQPRQPDDPHFVLDDYDKIHVEEVYLQSTQLPATVLRLPMVYGPGDYQHRLWEYLGRMRDGRTVIALDSVAADWRGCRAFVGDVAQAITLAAETELGRPAVYHLAETPAQVETDWLRRIGRAFGWNGAVESIAAEYWPEAYRCEGNMRQHWELDSSAIRTELGYSEITPLDEAMARAIEWELANLPGDGKPKGIPYEEENSMLQRWTELQNQRGQGAQVPGQA